MMRARTHGRWDVALAVLLCIGAATEASGQRPRQQASAPQTQPATTREVWVVETEQQATAKARAIVGLPDDPPATLSAEIAVLTEDNTPFLHGQITGRPVWHVAIAHWTLHLKSAPADEHDQYPRVFDLYIDPTNGRLLKAISRWPEGVPPVAPEPSAQSAEEQMPRSGQERYLAFPEVPPRVSLLQALDTVMKDGAGSPYLAKQILAHYVMQSWMGGEPRAVWAITLRGIPPIKPPDQGLSADALNHMRNIVDGQTGKWLGAGTCPQPETGAPAAAARGKG
jgi:hypothetical protein